jgi:hypothetical protein
MRMSLHAVLEDWSDYDDRKKKSGDAHYFACTEGWEVLYLVDKIHSTYGYVDRLAIREAVRHFCAISHGPHPRKLFVTSVLNRLGVI